MQSSFFRWMVVAAMSSLVACTQKTDPNEAIAWPAQPPVELKISDRKIEALIQCYKIMILARDHYSGTGAKSDGIAASLSPALQMVEDRLVGDLTTGADKMRINEKIEAQIQQLIADQPYGSAKILLDGARYCAGLEQRDAWRDMKP